MYGNQSFGFYNENYAEGPQQQLQDGGGTDQQQTGAGDNGSDPKNQNLGQRNTNKTNLIVNYLPQFMTEKELYTMFVTCGPVENVRIMRDFKTGYSYGFGFVNFRFANDAEKAIHTLNGTQYFNKKIKVSYARPPGQDIRDTNLYITGLPKNVTEEDLDQLFGEYGTIVTKNLLKDKISGMPRGVAFIRFDRREEASAAMTAMNGKQLPGCMEPVTIKIAEEHGKQKATYYEGWRAGFNMSKGMAPMRGGRGGYAAGGGIGGGGGGYPAPVGGYMGGRGGGGIAQGSAGRGRHRFNPMRLAGAGDMSYNMPMM